MKYLYFLIAFCSLTIQVTAQDIQYFQLQSTEGKTEYYTDLKGNTLTVIDFWATWCKPCINSIPKLIDMAEEFNPEEVAFIGISVDSPRNTSKVKPFARSLGINYPVLLDPEQELVRDLNVTAIPTLIILNTDDEIIYMHEGFIPGDESVIKNEIEMLLNES